MNTTFTESAVEQTTLAWLESAGWTIAHRPDIAPGIPAVAQIDCGEVLQKRWLLVG